MFTVLLSDLKKVFNSGLGIECWQRAYRVLRKTLTGSFFLLLSLDSGQTVAGAAVCQQFYLPELKSLCDQFPASQVTVHQNVPDKNLNSLREGWGTAPGLHILPPDSYPLTNAIELGAGQAILPHPSMALPNGQTLRTIILTAGSNFSNTDAHLYLLKLKPDSSAGGVEMHSSLVTNSSSSGDTRSLLQVELGGQINLVGSYLTSTPSGHSLNQLVRVETGQNSNSGSLYLARNIFKTSSRYGVIASMEPDQTITVENTLFRLSHNGGVGLAIFKGTGLVTNSDFVIEGSCSSGGCDGVSFNQTNQHSVSQSTFWATLKYPSAATGISLQYLNPGDLILETGSTGWLGTNLFGSQMVIMADDAAGKDDTLAGEQLRTEYLNREYPMSAVQFFNYTGKLGVTYLPSQETQRVCNNANGTEPDIDPSLFQKAISFGNHSFEFHYLPARPHFDNVPQHCIDKGQAVTYLIIGELISYAPVIAGLSFLAYLVGKRYRPTASFQIMAPENAAL